VIRRGGTESSHSYPEYGFEIVPPKIQSIPIKSSQGSEPLGIKAHIQVDETL
jgi:hypothetical protein